MTRDRATPIWEDLTEATPQRPAYGRRVFADGRFEEYSASKIIVEERAMKTRVEPRPLDWYPLTTLPAEKVARLEKLIDDSGFFALPAEIDVPQAARDVTTWTVTAHRGGKSHTVRVLKYPFNQPLKLIQLVNHIIELTAP